VVVEERRVLGDVRHRLAHDPDDDRVVADLERLAHRAVEMRERARDHRGAVVEALGEDVDVLRPAGNRAELRELALTLGEHREAEAARVEERLPAARGVGERDQDLRRARRTRAARVDRQPPEPPVDLDRDDHDARRERAHRSLEPLGVDTRRLDRLDERLVGLDQAADEDGLRRDLEIGVVADGANLRFARGNIKYQERWTNPRSAVSARCGAGGLRSSAATSVPDPPPSPGPGQVLAPMCQRPSTVVEWPGLCANGRQRKFWSSASAPPYGSPWRRLTFRRSRSCGPSATRRRTAESRFGTCFAIRCWMRSAYRSRSSSVQVPPPLSIVESSSPPASPLMRHGSSCSWIQRSPLPSGARSGSIVSGWPTTIVASAGRRPRSASLTARETPSSPGVTWTIAVSFRRSSPSQRAGSESAK